MINNPMMQQLNRQPTIPASAKQMASQIKALANPQAAVQKMLSSNPQAMALIQAANGNAEKAFRDLAAKMNVNPDEVIQLLRY